MRKLITSRDTDRAKTSMEFHTTEEHVKIHLRRKPSQEEHQVPKTSNELNRIFKHSENLSQRVAIQSCRIQRPTRHHLIHTCDMMFGTPRQPGPTLSMRKSCATKWSSTLHSKTTQSFKKLAYDGVPNPSTSCTVATSSGHNQPSTTNSPSTRAWDNLCLNCTCFSRKPDM